MTAGTGRAAALHLAENASGPVSGFQESLVLWAACAFLHMVPGSACTCPSAAFLQISQACGGGGGFVLSH